MKIIPRKVINQWYQAEYEHFGDESVYQSAPLALQKFYELLKKNKKTIKTVFDVGCGDGRTLVELAKLGFQVTGIDLFGKETAERRAKNAGVKINFIQADITTYEFGSARYDAIISSEVFHLIPRQNVLRLIDQIVEATNSGGFVYLSILSDLHRHFLKTGEEFKYEGQSDFSVADSSELLKSKFSNWNILGLETFPDEQDWPVKQGPYPIEPYHWSGEYVYLIAQKR